MIEGFKIDISADELREHLETKAAFHRDKADAYERQLGGISELMQDAPDGQSSDPRYSLSQKLAGHRKKQSYFAFLAAHVIAGETYRLPEHDLEMLEFFSRYG